jgi:CHC2 zinc finger/Toprim-like
MAITDTTLLDQLGRAGCIREFLSQVFPSVDFPSDRENQSVLCPFHGDHKASCSVNVNAGVFKCHSCDEKGTIFRFRAKVEKISQSEARQRFVEELKERSVRTTDQPEESVAARKETEKDLPSSEDIKRMSCDLLINPAYGGVLERLHARGIKDDVIAKLSLGAHTDSFEHGKFTGLCLVIPIFDETGEYILTLKKLLYHNGERYFKTDGKAKRLFNSHHLSRNPAELVFVTEGELDAIRLIQEELLAVSSVGGATCWDDKWAGLFQGRDVVVLYDSDEAGRKGARKVVSSLVSEAKTLKDVDLFPGSTDSERKDVTDYLREGGTKESLLALVADAPIVARQTSEPEITGELPLRDILKTKKGQESETLGELTYAWICSHGGRFFKDATHVPYVLHRELLLKIEEGSPAFEGYLYELTGFTTATIKGRVVVKVLRAKAEVFGEHVRGDAMVLADVRRRTIYLDLNHPGGKLIELSAGSVHLVANGSNTTGVLLSGSDALPPFTLLPLDEGGLIGAIEDLDRLVVQNLACTPESRLFVTLWALCFPFAEFVKTRPLMRFEGNSGGGKSSAMELLSSLVYGKDQKSINTAAAMYSEGSRVPILFLDNIERRNLYGEVFDFFLTSATGVSKKKRRTGTDTEVINEQVRCLICTSGIENMYGWELINRTYVVEFDRQKYGTTFSEEAFSLILKERDRIMSGVFAIYARVLDKIASGVWREYQAKIVEAHPDHSKDRTNSYLALMVIMADEIGAVLGRDNDSGKLLASWIGSQDAVSTETSVESDVIAQYLDQLLTNLQRSKSELYQGKWQRPYWMSGFQKDGTVQFRCLANQLHTAFIELLQGQTPPYRFKDARQLGKRISDSRGILQKAGWEVKEVRRVRGRAVWQFTYEPLVKRKKRGSEAMEGGSPWNLSDVSDQQAEPEGS